MLFRDPGTGCWVEPESFYPFPSRVFYEAEVNVFSDPEAGLSFEAVKATAWHGPPTISVLVKRGSDKLLFTSDTAYSRELWESLATERHPQKLGRLTREEFDRAHCLVGDINDFIEQTWSRERLDQARELYRECTIIHDVAGKNSVVHTDYANIAGEGVPQLLFTHAPDYFISQFPLAAYRKTLLVRGRQVLERVDGRLLPLAGDIFVRDKKRYRVGFKNPHGQYRVIRKEGILDVLPVTQSTSFHVIMVVDLFEDVRGRWLPVLTDPRQRYMVRPDGQVERVTYGPEGSSGVIEKDLRPTLSGC